LEALHSISTSPCHIYYPPIGASSYTFGDGFAEFAVLVWVEVDTANVAGDDDPGGLEEFGPLLLGEALVVLRELPGFRFGSFEHLRHVRKPRTVGEETDKPV
jgi:hypothetical protein